MLGGSASCPVSQRESAAPETPSALARGASPPQACRQRERVCIWGDDLAMASSFARPARRRCALAYIRRRARLPPANAVARAASRFQAMLVHDRDVAARIGDELAPLQGRSRFGDADTTHAQHAR